MQLIRPGVLGVYMYMYLLAPTVVSMIALLTHVEFFPSFGQSLLVAAVDNKYNGVCNLAIVAPYPAHLPMTSKVIRQKVDVPNFQAFIS